MSNQDTHQIGEYGEIRQISKEGGAQNDTLDAIYLPKAAWNELAVYANSSQKKHRFLGVKNTKVLKVKNFVGLITASGHQIEILPKIYDGKTDDEKSLNDSRELLWRMLKKVYKLPMLESTKAQIRIKKQSLPEALIGWFLSCMGDLIRYGICKDYTRVEAQERFLKGQLQVAKQINQGAHRAHIFNIAYDTFSDNRAENRLIHAALLQVLCWSNDFAHQKLARQYLMCFEHLPVSTHYIVDFSRWSKARDMAHYQPILPWLKFILNQQSPQTLKDKHTGISFLFPMEQLFEKYVARCVAEQLSKLGNYELIEQSTKHYLAQRGDEKMFQLKPDLLIRQGTTDVLILDCKWKQIDQKKTYSNSKENHKLDPKMGISQADMYQLFAYGKKYGVSKVVLIYPKWSGFEDCFGFDLDDNLSLLVVPFCLQQNTLSKPLDAII